MIFPSLDHFDRLSSHLHAAYVRLTKDEALWQGDFAGALRHIATELATAFEVAGVSVWLLREDNSALECTLRFDASAGRFVTCEPLLLTQCPHYFRALDGSRVLDAADALNDHRTTELTACLREQNVGALLQATLHRAGHLAGAISVEHTGSARLWRRDEQSMLVAVADMLSQLLVFHALKDSERCYRTLVDCAGDAITTLRNGRFVDCNQRALELFGYTRGEFLAQRPEQLSPPTQPDGSPSCTRWEGMLQQAAHNSTQYYEWVYRRADGSEFEAEVSLAGVRLANEDYILAIVRDVTERRQAERARVAAASQLEQRNSTLQVVNNLASRLHGTADIRVIGEETVRALHALHHQPLLTFYRLMPDGETLELMAGVGFDDLLAQGFSLPVRGSLNGLALTERKIMLCSDLEQDERLHEQARQRLLERGVRSMMLLPLLYRDEPMGTIGLLYTEPGVAYSEVEMDTLRAICQTVSLSIANARHVQVLEYQALHDSLTGLPNRTQLHREAAQAILRADQARHGIALMLLDLDRFKEINDTLGHHTGDSLLKQVASRLSRLLGERNALLMRLGGDEFAILARHITGAPEATALAGTVLATLRQPFEAQGLAIELGGSIGVAIYPYHGDTSHALLRCADVAMYAAKSTVGNISIYDPEHDQHNPRRLAMITELGAAITGDQLLLHFQPKLDLQSGRWTGCEALVRWSHPLLGQIPPGEFIQFAEMSDLIRSLTLWVARQAIAQLARWRAFGHEVSVAINLSTRNLLDVTFPQALGELIAEYGVPPEALELEITETALMGDPERAMMVVDRLMQTGVRLAIDDFGTGYSSLAYLKRLPLTTLKLDRSFVQDMTVDQQDAIIVRSTINLAHSLGIRVVAEGVEDAATLAALRECGCDEAQGFHLSRPIAAGLVDELLGKPFCG